MLHTEILKVTKRLVEGRPKTGAILTYRIEVENVGGDLEWLLEGEHVEVVVLLSG